MIFFFDGRKIAGGAQRRLNGCLLHQGSVHLPNSLQTDEFIDAFCDSFAQIFAFEYAAFQLNHELVQRIEEKQNQKYLQESWNARL